MRRLASVKTRLQRRTPLLRLLVVDESGQPRRGGAIRCRPAGLPRAGLLRGQACAGLPLQPRPRRLLSVAQHPGLQRQGS